MPRRNVPRQRGRRPAGGPTASGRGTPHTGTPDRGSITSGGPLSIGTRTETGPDGEDWLVRSVGVAQASKTYRCPGCDHEITPATAHVVAWPSAEFGGAAERRHWHSGCWSGRGRRGLTRRWS